MSEAWWDYLRNVNRLKTDAVAPIRPPSRLRPIEIIRNIPQELPILQGNEPLRRYGLRDLKNAPIEGRLDLHGYTRTQAESHLYRFLTAHIRQQHRWVLVITGKGNRSSEETLRSQIPRWLDQFSQYVIGYGYAPPHQGGEGALYVHLRLSGKKRGSTL